MSSDDPLALATQVASRGNNLVLLAPPSPAWAVPALAGISARRLADRSAGPVLGLCPAEAIDEWARVARRSDSSGTLRVVAARSPGRIARLLHAGDTDLVLLTPELALELVRRAVLKLESVSGVLLLNPESFGGDDTLSALLPDLPRDTPRTLVTAEPAAAAPLIERYCWRAPAIEVPGLEAPPLPEVRVAEVAWQRRGDALPELLEQLDPTSPAVWVADRSDADAVGRIVADLGAEPRVTSDLPAAGDLIIAWDLPTPGRLAELAAQGPVVLLVPPGGGRYLTRLALRRRPVPLRGAVDQARAEVAASRRAVSARIDEGVSPAASLALAPLLERFEASAVAAALYDLWQAKPAPAAAAAPAALPSAKIWIGIGRKDEVTVNDLVAALAKDASVPREAIGKVEIRETFTLVELRGADPAAVAERLTGKSIRKRRLVARPDKGRER